MKKSSSLSFFVVLTIIGCTSPEKFKEYALGVKPLELCNEYNIAFETNDAIRISIYKEAIQSRQINCQTYKNDLAILANQRYIKTLVGP